MINFDDTSYKEAREPGALDIGVTFYADELDANIAFYIGAFDSYIPPEVYEDYVSLKAFTYEFDLSQTDPSEWQKSYPHPMRRCTKEDAKLIKHDLFEENIGANMCLDNIQSLGV